MSRYEAQYFATMAGGLLYMSLLLGAVLSNSTPLLVIALGPLAVAFVFAVGALLFNGVKGAYLLLTDQVTDPPRKP